MILKGDVDVRVLEHSPARPPPSLNGAAKRIDDDPEEDVEEEEGDDQHKRDIENYVESEEWRVVIQAFHPLPRVPCPQPKLQHPDETVEERIARPSMACFHHGRHERERHQPEKVNEIDPEEKGLNEVRNSQENCLEDVFEGREFLRDLEQPDAEPQRVHPHREYRRGVAEGAPEGNGSKGR
eukprot:CAMPEP_0180243520 /NCGR_PEP_ID=MMETSP0987-20121128/33885_1 /TAXON_ID=697907 /ORGANISM="non described non described, Strain CCMP2293" /LENGTH=181 /DNA_ID=CAMNT_0022210875 /DNA_START=264 /DNA_END=810 /DNA_ORIENTATION=-